MFCFEEFKYSSSCISKCNSFYLISWDGVISFLTISIHVLRFTCCQEWGILNPLISSLELSCVIFHLNPSIGNVAICGAYHWSKLSPYPSRWKRFFHLFVDLKQAIVSVSGRLSPHHFETFAISPQQACDFRCWFCNNSVQFFFARVLSKLICGTSCHFLLRPFIPTV